MKKVKIGNSANFILVDNSDFETINSHAWLLNRGGYPQTRHKGKLILLHHLLIKVVSPNVCDHINRNRLDYRRENLRVVTRVQNNANRKPNKGAKTKGVYFDKRALKKPFQAYICTDNKKFHLGYFSTLEEASSVYDKEASKRWGKFALLNKFSEKTI